MYDWDPIDWQTFVLQLLRERHGPSNVQRVPDRHRGDLGMEAFTLDGCIYQCYAPEYSINPSALTDKIKAKLHQDIRKMMKNSVPIEELLGAIKINRWILVVPLFDDKEVIRKCQVETEQVLKAGLSFVLSDFRAVVLDQSDFATEREALVQRAAIKARVRGVEAEEEEIDAWRQSNVELAERVEHKLRRGFPESKEEERKIKLGLYVRWNLERDNLLETLRQDTPHLWDSLQGTITSAERRLETLGHDGGDAREILKTHVDGLRTDVAKMLSGFNDLDIERIAFGTIADWLVRCPLDFPSKAE